GSPFGSRLGGLTLGKPRDALGESILGNELGAAHTVFRLGRERGIAATVEIESHHFGEAIAPHIQRLSVLQALEESELLFIHLEQFGIASPVECRVLEKQERCAGVHDAVGVLAQVLNGLADHGHTAKVFADGLNRRERSFQKLAVLHRREDLFDEDVLGDAEIDRVIEHVIDAAEKPHHQWLDQVGVLLVVDFLEVEALDARERKTVFYVVEDGVVDTFSHPFRQVAIQLLRKEQIAELAVFRVEQVDVLHGLVDHLIVLRLQFRASIDEQQFDKGIEKLDVAFGGLQREQGHAWTVFTNAIHTPAVQLNNAFIAPTDVEDVGKSAVLLLQCDGLVGEY